MNGSPVFAHEITGHFDGGCEPRNPGGHTGYGATLDGPDGHLTFSGYVGVGPAMSNNVGEYSGVIRLFEELLKRGCADRRILIKGDSQMVIRQMSGEWRIRPGERKLYLPFALVASKLRSQFTNIRFQWVPREKNAEADALAAAAVAPHLA